MQVVEVNGPEFAPIAEHIPLVEVGVYETIGVAVGCQRKKPVLDVLPIAPKLQL